jgi:hypothetical protein
VIKITSLTILSASLFRLSPSDPLRTVRFPVNNMGIDDPNRGPARRAMTHQQKITLGEMRSSGVRSLLVYCADYHCAHAVRISSDRWPDHIRLSDLEPLFVCQACGRRGASDIGIPQTRHPPVGLGGDPKGSRETLRTCYA